LLFKDRTAGVFTLFLLGSSTLLFYSIVICQETGLTALSMIACVYYLERSKGESVADIVIAAIAVSAGALCREYGGIFVIFGLMIMCWKRFSPGKIAIYLAVCSLLVAPWYIRTLIITGNAHYDVLGLKTYMSTKLILPLLTGLALVLALPCIPGLIAIFMSLRRLGYVFIISTVMLSLLLYHIIVPAGLFHAMRMLSPMIVLLAVCGSYLFCMIVQKFKKSYAPIVWILSLFCLITAVQNTVVPCNPLNLKSDQWLMASCIVPDSVDMFGDFFNEIDKIPEGSRILCDDSRYHYALLKYKERSRNIRLVTVCSPEIGFLYDPSIGFDEANARLEKLGIRYVMIGRHDNIQFLYLEKFKFYSEYAAHSKLIGLNLCELPPSKLKQIAEPRADK
jgi:hypothetical protein